MSESSWINSIVDLEDGYEEVVFQQYARRLIGLARTKLPDNLQRRVDADDIVQSVFRSFFRRNQEGQFAFDDSFDVWHLLAAITYRKVLNSIKHHYRDKRNPGREVHAGGEDSMATGPPIADRTPGPEDLNVVVDYLNWILGQLPEDYQGILQMRMEGFSIAEIAEKIDVSERTVKRVLARVRDLAAQKLDDELQEP
ncbi:MAG: sigma-70 family RNA polymerase sigma factor [Planctomycetota bacterium]